jgi:Zn finger protein HypA/HybF involved in hydrogenase expression
VPGLATAEKAATLTRDGELTTEYFNFAIQKVEQEPDTGDVICWGKATDGSLDSDSQIIDPAFAAKAIQEWVNDGANIRVQHNPQLYPAGVGIEANTDDTGATWVKGRIIEPVAQKLVLGGALRAYSVGIARPTIVRDAIAKGGRITGGQIVEVSLVDRPANRNCAISILKSDKNGHAVLSGEIIGDNDFIQKAIGNVSTVKTKKLKKSKKSDFIKGNAGSPGQVIEGDVMTATAAEKMVILEMPEDISISFTPSDLARVIAKRKSPNVGEDTHHGGVDRDSLSDEDFAGAHRSFPVSSPGDVSDAASSLGRAGNDNFDQDTIKNNIKRIAHRKGPDYVAQLPDSWKNEDASMRKQEAREYLTVKYGWLPSQLDELSDESLTDLLTATKAAEAEVTKAACTLCHGTGKIREGHMTCPRCHGSGAWSDGTSSNGNDSSDDDPDDVTKSDDAPGNTGKQKHSNGDFLQDGTTDENADGANPGGDPGQQSDGGDGSDDDNEDADPALDGSDDDNERTEKSTKRCKTCKGDGRILGGNRKCPDCGGTGARVKKSAQLPTVTKDWTQWDQEHGGSGKLPHGQSEWQAAHDALAEQAAGKKISPEQQAIISQVHGEHTAHEAHEEHLAHEARMAAGAQGTPAPKLSEDAGTARALTTPLTGQQLPGVSKSAKITCKCGGMMKAKHAFCPACGAARGGTDDMPEKTGAKKSADVEVIKGDVPGEGVKGEEGKQDPVPQHREPDGAMNEAWEDDAKMQDGDESQAQEQPTKLEQPMMKGEVYESALQRIISKGIPSSIGILHDLTCPAFSPQAIAKCYPQHSVANVVDENFWQQKSLQLTATLPFAEAVKASRLGSAAVILKSAPDDWIMEERDLANKAFSDANPGPGTAPTPVSMTPRAYSRPYLSAGHAAPSPQQGSPNSAPMISGSITADQFNRPPLLAGHEAPSPANSPGLSQAVGQAIDASVTMNGILASAQAANGSSLASAIPGRPSVASLPASFPGISKNRTFYSNTTKEQTRAAMQAIHDHAAKTFPDLCPMHGEDEAPAEKSAAGDLLLEQEVPAQLIKSAASAASSPIAQALDQLDGTDVPKTLIKREKRRQKLEKLLRAEAALAEALLPRDAELITKAEVITPVDERVTIELDELRTLVKKQDKVLKKQARALDELNAQPDPAVQAFRGILPGLPTLNKQASQAPVGPGSMADVAERTQAMMLRELEGEFRHSPDPAMREAAWKSMLKLRGVG